MAVSLSRDSLDTRNRRHFCVQTIHYGLKTHILLPFFTFSITPGRFQEIPGGKQGLKTTEKGYFRPCTMLPRKISLCKCYREYNSRLTSRAVSNGDKFTKRVSSRSAEARGSAHERSSLAGTLVEGRLSSRSVSSARRLTDSVRVRLGHIRSRRLHAHSVRLSSLLLTFRAQVSDITCGVVPVFGKL